jgi:hypothetical protein
MPPQQDLSRRTEIWMEYLKPLLTIITDIYGTAVGVSNQCSYKIGYWRTIPMKLREAHVNYITIGMVYVIRNGGSDHK